jgi:hypothetical protein
VKTIVAEAQQPNKSFVHREHGIFDDRAGWRDSTRLYVHGIAVFIPLNLMVSIFSLKVASLIWFLFGYFFMSDYSVESSALFDARIRADAGLRARMDRASV